MWSALVALSSFTLSDGLATTNTWTGSISSQLDLAGNWDPDGPEQPSTAGDQAVFGAGATSFSPSLSDGNTFGLYEALFTSPSSTYAFQIDGASALVFGLSGDTHQELVSGVTNTVAISVQQSFIVEEEGVIVFYGFATAAQNDTLDVKYLVGRSTPGALQFQDQASAGFGQFSIGDWTDASTVDFYDSSTAKESTLSIGLNGVGSGRVNFQERATAGHATISVGDVDSTTSNFGIVHFYDESTAGTCTLNVGDSLGASTLNFHDVATADSSTIKAKGTSTTQPTTGTINFYDQSTAENAQITVGDTTTTTNSSGVLNFYNASTAGSSHVSVGDHLGDSNIHFYSDSATVFSTAGSSNIVVGTTSTQTKDLDGTLTFHGYSTAGQSTIVVSDENARSHLYFKDSSTAGTSSITLGNAEVGLMGHANFEDSSSASSSHISVTNGSVLEFAVGSSGGTSSIALSTTGTLEMAGPASYSVGSLTSDASSFARLGGAGLTVDYNGSSAIEMAGLISGSGGSLVKSGAGTFLLTGSCTYTGLTTVAQGSFVNNGSIAENVLVTGGTFSGTGSIGGSLTVNGGTIAPGNSPGTMIVSGDYTQGSSAIYLVQIQNNLSSLLEVSGSTTLDFAPVSVVLLDGGFYPNHPYLILETAEGITGSFVDPVIDYSASGINRKLLQASISYDPNTKAFLLLETTLENVAKTSNQKHVAKRLDAISNPNTREVTLLNDLVHLDTGEAKQALSQLSGELYTNWLFIQERANQKFLHSLYEPLRSELISSSCDRCQEKNVTIWVDGGVGRSFLDSKHGIAGLHVDNYETSLGAHKKIGQKWTVGIAGGYEHDRISYRIGGGGMDQTWLGGLYSLYRPKAFYVLMDLISGYSQNKVHRFIDVDQGSWTTSGKAKVSQIGLYGESGFDVRSKYVLMQPFLGVQGGHYHQHKIKEKGTYPIRLTLQEKDRNTASSRLGLHITGYPNSCLGFFGVDCAWQCLLTAQEQELQAQFQAFGDSFTLTGVSLPRNSLEGAIFIQGSLGKCWHVFARAAGQKWYHASAYDVTLGIETSW